MKPEKRLVELLNVNPEAECFLVDGRGTEHRLASVDISYDGKRIALYAYPTGASGAFLASGPEEVR